MSEKKKKSISIAVLVIGIATLIVGAVLLILNLISDKTADAEFLIEKKVWTLESSDSVVWNFTEAGKGTLTTNNHTNDYDFAWAIEDGKLKITTSWLYDMNNEYEYSLDKGSSTLTLKDGEEEVRFVVKQ